MPKITAIHAREILDSRGNPTVEASVTLEDGIVAVAAVPSGASTGTFEAVELRDNEARYGGLGVRKAVDHVNGEIAERIVGMDSADQSAIDTAMIELDGTKNKGRLGANAILGVSLAAARAEALSRGIPLYRYLRTLTQDAADAFPIPLFNIVNGGKHSNSGLSVQEFKIVPSGIDTYPEQLRAGSEIFHALKALLEEQGFSTGVGDEGGFAPKVESHERQLELITQAIERAGYARGRDIFLDLDVAADSFYEKGSGLYALEPEGKRLSREEIVSLYGEWMERFDIVSIEDGLYEEDWEGWPKMKSDLTATPAAWGRSVLLVGDDFLVTNIERLERAIEADACNAVLIKVNQIGTLSETLRCMERAKEAGMARIISHRSGETTDDFIADLAVGAGAEFIKTGSLARGERIVKYNRLSAIWEELSR